MTWDTTKNTDFKTWSGQPEPIENSPIAATSSGASACWINRSPAPATKAEVIAKLADLLAQDILTAEQFVRVIEALQGKPS